MRFCPLWLHPTSRQFAPFIAIRGPNGFYSDGHQEVLKKKCFVFETPGSERESVCVSVSALQTNYVYDRISFLYEFTGIMILVHFSFSLGRICRWCAVAFNSCVLHVWCSDSLFILDFFLHHLLPSCARTQIWLCFRLIDMTLLFCMCLARGGRAQRQDVS